MIIPAHRLLTRHLCPCTPWRVDSLSHCQRLHVHKQKARARQQKADKKTSAAAGDNANASARKAETFRPYFSIALYFLFLPSYAYSASGCQKTHGELERAEALSNLNRARRRVRRVRGDFCGGKSHFPEQKSLPCSFCARKSERFQQKLVGVVVAGELAPPSTSLSKRLF